MISKYEAKTLPIILIVLDVGAVFLAFSIALYLRFPLELFTNTPTIGNAQQYWYLMMSMLPIWIFNLAYFKLYNPQYVLHGNQEYGRIVNAATTTIVHTMVIIYLIKADFARGWVLLTWLTAIIFLLTGRYLHRQIHKSLVDSSNWKLPVVLVGANSEARSLMDEIKRSDFGMRIIGAVAGTSQAPATGLRILGSINNLSDIIKNTGAQAAVVIPSALPPSALQGLYYKLASANVDTFISPSLFEIISSRALITPINDTPLIRLENVSFSGIKYYIKRALDIASSITLLIIFMPLFLIISLLIRIESRGPIFFTQRRIGRRGNIFKIYKFLSMYKDAERQKTELLHLNEATGPIFKIKDDPRVTGIGKWLRRFSIDELPQLYNVFIGEMSLVGPRPAISDEVKTYSDWERRRLDTHPGMTGLWQVSGRSNTTFKEMVRLDLYYIENWSPLLDLTILVRTIKVVFMSKGAY